MRTILALALLALLAAPANATLIADRSSFGATSITVDTLTGLRWLDLPASQGLSTDAVEAGFVHGGTFFGFRYATGAELCALTNALFGRTGCAALRIGSNVDPGLARAFIDLFGPTNPAFGGNVLLGLLEPQPAAGQILSAFFTLRDPPFAEGDIQGVVFPNHGATFEGHWLIQEFAVSAPWSLVLLAVGLLPVVRRR